VSRPMLFLGESCKRFSRRPFWEKLDARTIPQPYDDAEAACIYDRLEALFQKLLPELSDRLNAIHGTRHGFRYWRILLGPWLRHYLHASFDRYSRLKAALSAHPDLVTVVLDERCYVVPSDSREALDLLKTDFYNLQLVSNILAWMGYEFPVRRQDPPASNEAAPGWRKTLKRWILKMLALNQSTWRILFKDAGFSHGVQMRLIWRTRGMAWPMPITEEKIRVPLDPLMRRRLAEPDWGQDEFEHLSFRLIAKGMPLSMVEGYGKLRSIGHGALARVPRAILSAVSWHFDDAFKVWAADAAERGTMLLGVQHGGNYGSLERLIQRTIELDAVDRFYSWGWESSDPQDVRVIPLPSALLSDRKIAQSPPDADILMVVTHMSRFLLHFPMTEEYGEDYFRAQRIFIGALSTAVLSQLRVRPHAEDMGCDAEARLRDVYPTIRIEGWGVSLSESIARCRLFVCDHALFSTTCLEALCANRPSIWIYHPHRVYDQLRKDAEPYFEKLASVGVLYSDPRRAAETVNAIQGHPFEWWMETARQTAIRDFIERFARTAADSLAAWIQELDVI